MSNDETPFRIVPIENGLELSFDVHAIKGERQTKKARFGSFEIICDESALIGGDDSAPPPLAFFASSVAF